MRKSDNLPVVLTLIALGLSMAGTLLADGPDSRRGGDDQHGRKDTKVQLGPRPFYLIRGMDDGPLKSKLLQC